MVCLFMSPYQVLAVFDLGTDGSQMSFRVEGPEDAQITVELGGREASSMKYILTEHRQNGDQPGGKLSSA